VIVIRKTLGQLSDQIVGVCTYSIEGDYPTDFRTYDEDWENLRLSLAHLRDQLGEARYAQLTEMAARAKAHFEKAYTQAGWEVPGNSGIDRVNRIRPGDPGHSEIKLGAQLMQDMEQVVKGKPPYAYPEDMYPWPRKAMPYERVK
jgi:hypothetical protein